MLVLDCSGEQRRTKTNFLPLAIPDMKKTFALRGVCPSMLWWLPWVGGRCCGRLRGVQGPGRVEPPLICGC